MTTFRSCFWDSGWKIDWTTGLLLYQMTFWKFATVRVVKVHCRQGSSSTKIFRASHHSTLNVFFVAHFIFTTVSYGVYLLFSVHLILIDYFSTWATIRKIWLAIRLCFVTSHCRELVISSVTLRMFWSHLIYFCHLLQCDRKAMRCVWNVDLSLLNSQLIHLPLARSSCRTTPPLLPTYSVGIGRQSGNERRVERTGIRGKTIDTLFGHFSRKRTGKETSLHVSSVAYVRWKSDWTTRQQASSRHGARDCFSQHIARVCVAWSSAPPANCVLSVENSWLRWLLINTAMVSYLRVRCCKHVHKDAGRHTMFVCLCTNQQLHPRENSCCARHM